jgi:hypothetical protein
MQGIGAITGLLTTGLSMMGAAQQRSQQAEAVAKSDIFEEYNQEVMGKEGFLKATQTSSAMTQHLTEVVDNIRAVRASAGAEVGSPTGDVITNATQAIGGQDIARTVLNIQEEAQQHLAAAAFYKQSAQDAISSAQGGIF